MHIVFTYCYRLWHIEIKLLSLLLSACSLFCHFVHGNQMWLWNKTAAETLLITNPMDLLIISQFSGFNPQLLYHPSAPSASCVSTCFLAVAILMIPDEIIIQIKFLPREEEREGR